MRLLAFSCVTLLALFAASPAVQAEIIADARAEFSGTQGSNKWYYGYYDRTADIEEGGDGIYTNDKFSRFRGGSSSASCETGANNDWYFGYWTYKPCEIFPQTEITSETMLPNTAGNTEHYAVMRWQSEKSGTANLTGYFFQDYAGPSDGTIGRIFRNGEEIFAEKTLGEQKDFDIRIPNLAKGDEFDFVVDFGSDYGGNGNNDFTTYSFIVDHTGDGVFGDFDGSGVLDAADINDLTSQVAGGTNPSAYDLNSDSKVDVNDINVWVKDLFNSWIGDANLDGEFGSSDLVEVLSTGTYEADVDAVWTSGDFDGSGRAGTSDLVVALADGGYESGPRAAVSAVPEPTSLVLLVLGVLPLWRRRR